MVLLKVTILYLTECPLLRVVQQESFDYDDRQLQMTAVSATLRPMIIRLLLLPAATRHRAPRNDGWQTMSERPPRMSGPVVDKQSSPVWRP